MSSSAGIESLIAAEIWLKSAGLHLKKCGWQ